MATPRRGNMELVAIRAAHQRRNLSLLILFFLMWSFTSCATRGEPFRRGESVPGKSSLYMYYAHGLFSSSFAWPVYLDGKKVTELRRGGYFYSTVSPGIHTISMKLNSQERSLNLSNFLVPTWVLESVLETQALDDLKDMKLQPGISKK